MFCEKCGEQNSEGAQFCGRCGEPMGNSANEELDQEPIRKPKKKSVKKWVVFGVALILVAFCVGGLLAVSGRKEQRDYEKYLDQANKYLEELDYENAETSYLEAISVSPREKEPYLKLAELYLSQEEFGKAEKILEEGMKMVPEDPDEPDQSLTNKHDEVTRISYTWMVKPEIEADDIFYMRQWNAENSLNEMERQDESAYAVIRIDDQYGMIGIDGTLATDVNFERIAAETNSCYRMIGENWQDTRYFDAETGQILTEDMVDFDGENGSYPGAFYYCDGVHNVEEALEELNQGNYPSLPETAIGLKQSDTLYNGEGEYLDWIDILEEKYAVCNGEELMTDFIYDECGTASSGLLAVKEGDKWGYVNEKGKTVIPTEYDATWECLSIVSEIRDPEDSPIEYCYAATDGYIPVRKGDKWALKDTSGKTIISAGIFEEILPVYQGQCWVKKDGKWGVIAVKGEDSLPPKAETQEPEKVEKEEEPEESKASPASQEEIIEMVIEHLEQALLDGDGGSYSIFEEETTETDTEYMFLLHYAMSEEQAEEIIASGGVVSANRLVGAVRVNKQTMEAVFENELGEEVLRWTL